MSEADIFNDGELCYYDLYDDGDYGCDNYAFLVAHPYWLTQRRMLIRILKQLARFLSTS